MAYFLAIDSGGTQAQYVLADETRELARVVSRTIKTMRVSADVAADNLAGALEELERLTGVRMHSVSMTCVGAAGNSIPLVSDWLRRELAARVAGNLLLLNDVEIALDAAFHGGPGILVLAGTGSNVVGRSSSGVLTNAGGWGPVLADQGSGHRIGLGALRALFLALDEGEPTTLLHAFLRHWKLHSRDELVSYANSCSHAEFSQLTHPVQLAATAGDEVAIRVLANEGEELAHLAVLVDRRLRTQEDPDAIRRIAFAGGVMAHLPLVRDALLQRVHAEIMNLQEVPGVVHGVDGALWRARLALVS